MSRGKSTCKHCGEQGHHTGSCVRWTGVRFGRLVVLRGAPMKYYPGGGKAQCVRARCDCGAEKVIPMDHLRRGAVTSCGCSRLDTSCGIMADVKPAVPIPEHVMVFGARMTIGELAIIAGKRPDQIWRRMRFDKMTAEEAAFGKAVAKKRAKDAEVDQVHCAARRSLSEWASEHRSLREHAEFIGVFDAIAKVCDVG